jgi:hypothetical protein
MAVINAMMIEDDKGEIWRIQCKTGRINKEGTLIKFDTANHNVTGKNRQMRHYRGQCDYFAVYCEALNKVYLIPVEEVGTTRAHLRINAAKNNQEKHVRWAKDYEI